ncbi:carboxypeptidase regulatory-like domain-containing protein, partial [Candidatus Chloroploca sp. Khr17]|uniref:carboxypeptidase regulatory-like domain-containing protein n=1 Tax=Candidatus Chloroploca sp. Khr17 TaxID=2496869 RepID=UPI0013EB794E
YAENESEVRFSNCLDKDMITQVSVTVITNSGDSPEETDVMLTNTSEPELALVYEVELDATGYFMWEEFRKGTYDVYVEKNGFAPIMETVEIDGPTNLSYILEELLAPVADLHVTPTGFATWRPGGVIPFEPASFDFEADAQGWDIQGNVNGWQWGNNASLSSAFMNFNGNSTNFIAANADAAGSGGTPIVAMAKSPMMTLENADQVYLSFDYKLTTDDLSVHYSIADGAPVLIEQLAAASAWTAHTVMLPEEALAADVQIIFLYEEASTWGYGAGVDNVVVSDVEPDSRALEYYKVWLDGIFVTDTPETFYQYDPATLVPGQEYFSEVAAVYSNG